MTQRELLETK